MKKEKGGGRQEKEVRGGGLQCFFLLPEKKPFGFRNRLIPVVKKRCLCLSQILADNRKNTIQRTVKQKAF